MYQTLGSGTRPGFAAAILAVTREPPVSRHLRATSFPLPLLWFVRIWRPPRGPLLCSACASALRRSSPGRICCSSAPYVAGTRRHQKLLVLGWSHRHLQGRRIAAAGRRATGSASAMVALPLFCSSSASLAQGAIIAFFKAAAPPTLLLCFGDGFSASALRRPLLSSAFASLPGSAPDPPLLCSASALRLVLLLGEAWVPWVSAVSEAHSVDAIEASELVFLKRLVLVWPPSLCAQGQPCGSLKGSVAAALLLGFFQFF